MKNFINAFLLPFKNIKLERELSHVIHHLNGPSFMRREEVKELFKQLIYKTDPALYPVIVNAIVPDNTLSMSLKNLIDDDDFYHLVENLPHKYFQTKSANDFIYRLQEGSGSTARDVKFNIFLLLINHYEGEDKKNLINRTNEMLFNSIFSGNLSPDKTINSKTVQKWASNEKNKLPLNADIFWKHAHFYIPRAIEIYVEQYVEKVDQAFSFCSDTLPTHEKYISDYKNKVLSSNYRLEHVRQRDLKVLDEFMMKKIIGKEYDLLDKVIEKKEVKPLKMKNKI
jgi:hypothetical protein